MCCNSRHFSKNEQVTHFLFCFQTRTRKLLLTSLADDLRLKSNQIIQFPSESESKNEPSGTRFFDAVRKVLSTTRKPESQSNGLVGNIGGAGNSLSTATSGNNPASGGAPLHPTSQSSGAQKKIVAGNGTCHSDGTPTVSGRHSCTH